MKQRDPIAGAVAGLAGGLVASLVMSQFQTAVSALVSDDSSETSNGQIPANEKAARQISEGVFGHKLTKAERKEAGEAIHYAMGGFSGMLYGIAAEFSSVPTIGSGLPFGAAVWLAADDVAVPALGLSKPASEFPLSTHAYALTSHLVYGLATDLVRRAVRKAL